MPISGAPVLAEPWPMLKPIPAQKMRRLRVAAAVEGHHLLARIAEAGRVLAVVADVDVLDLFSVRERVVRHVLTALAATELTRCRRAAGAIGAAVLQSAAPAGVIGLAKIVPHQPLVWLRTPPAALAWSQSLVYQLPDSKWVLVAHQDVRIGAVAAGLAGVEVAISPGQPRNGQSGQEHNRSQTAHVSPPSSRALQASGRLDKGLEIAHLD